MDFVSHMWSPEIIYIAFSWLFFPFVISMKVWLQSIWRKLFMCVCLQVCRVCVLTFLNKGIMHALVPDADLYSDEIHHNFVWCKSFNSYNCFSMNSEGLKLFSMSYLCKGKSWMVSYKHSICGFIEHRVW